ncbi:DUF2637 domain-containing protein [Micromonospora sp. WMMA1363]|uniref:DUF2637 domain-containing protein n=1 Tax=Micromonospora sp. WMMA1363 TaxID=3053985 RepID=UPI00259CAEF7|nr:DUF2637 domain-containing protein [Micromonospora sp. WMMA1363]MDM4718433.1 DUF2637 domain-containing protein [Micromonospora sp. WMMA1363]
MKALRWLVGLGTLLIAAGGFTLSFGKLNQIAIIAGYGDNAWIYPAIVEGCTTLATLAAFLRHGKRGAWYPWAVGLLAFGYSLCANSVPGSVPVEVIRAVPVMCIPVSVHTFIIIVGLLDKRESEALADQSEAVAVPQYDTLADIFPVDQAESGPSVQPEPVKVEPAKRERRATALAGRGTYLRLAEQAKTDRERDMFLRLATGQPV